MGNLREGEKMLAQVKRIKIGKQLMGLLLFLVIFGWSASAAEAVTLVFVHGKGSGKDTVDNVRYNYWTQDMINACTRNGQAKSLVVSYDGTSYYWMQREMSQAR
jgi:hypothetical protein